MEQNKLTALAQRVTRNLTRHEAPLGEAALGEAPLMKAHVEGHYRTVNGKQVFVHPYETHDNNVGASAEHRAVGSFLVPGQKPVEVTGGVHHGWLHSQKDLKVATVPELSTMPYFTEKQTNDFVRRSGWVKHRDYGKMQSYILRDDPASWKEVQKHYDAHGAGKKAHIAVLKDHEIYQPDWDEMDDDWDSDFNEALHDPAEDAGQDLVKTYRQKQRLSKSLPVAPTLFKGMNQPRPVAAVPRANHKYVSRERGPRGWVYHYAGQTFQNASRAMKAVLAVHPKSATPPANPSIASGGKDTEAMHSKNGVYHPARAALHEQVINHFLNHRNLPEHYNGQHPLLVEHADANARPQAVFFAGGAGSGKGFSKKQHFGHHPSFVDVDPDEIKAHLSAADDR